MTPAEPAAARRLLAATAAEQARARVPSLAAGVVRDGELVWSAGRGSVEPGAAVVPTPDTQYRIGSITKVLTTLLVLQLRDEGRLRLTDRVDAHLTGVPFGDRSVRELLSHSGGIPAEPPGSWWERSPGRDFETIVGALGDGLSDAVFPPGRQYHYSNLGFALLGRVVAQARGAGWMEVLTQRVLQPLGMLRTTYHAVPPAAAGYSVDTFAGTLTPEPSHDSKAMAPAGQLWSTVADLGRLAGFLASPDDSACAGGPVLAAHSVAEMATLQAGTPDGVAGGGYGLGLRLFAEDGRGYAGHTGSVPGFLAGLFVDRDRRTGAVCLANGAAGLRCQGLPVELMTTLEDAEPALTTAWEPVGSVPSVARDLLGIWYWGNLALSFGYDGHRLVVTGLGDPAPWCTFDVAGGRVVGSTGYYAGEELLVRRRPDGRVGHLECATFVFTRTPYDTEAPIPGSA